ncbi:putative metal chaperone YciC [compost metagenome]
MYPDYAQNRKEIESRWDHEFGDRLNELVIIAQDLDEKTMQENMQACLLSPQELKDYKNKVYFENPFDAVLS